jgi:hypothetical protein
MTTNDEILALLRDIKAEIAEWRAETRELLRRIPLAYPEEALIDEARDAARSTAGYGDLIRMALIKLSQKYNPFNLNTVRRLMRSDA